MSFIEANNNGIVPLTMRACYRSNGVQHVPSYVTVMDSGEWVETSKLELYLDHIQRLHDAENRNSNEYDRNNLTDAQYDLEAEVIGRMEGAIA